MNREYLETARLLIQAAPLWCPHGHLKDLLERLPTQSASRMEELMRRPPPEELCSPDGYPLRADGAHAKAMQHPSSGALPMCADVGVNPNGHCA